MASFIVLVVLVIAGLLAPVIAPYDPYDAENIDIMNSEIPPAGYPRAETGFLLGTDIQGRDCSAP
jgi:peptide/nickel transport system permease protein